MLVRFWSMGIFWNTLGTANGRNTFTGVAGLVSSLPTLATTKKT